MSEENLCWKCPGKCCRYFAHEIDKPKTKREFDDVRWFLCHEGIKVFVDDGKWFLEVMNVCRHLEADNLCRIYEDRPAICREHSTDDCERSEAHLEHELEFHDDEELARYATERLRKRKAKGKAKARREK